MIIKTKQFTLRPFKITDATELAQVFNNKRIIDYLALEIFPYKKEHAVFYIKEQLPQYKKKQPGFISLVIEIDGNIAGGIGLHKIDHGHQSDIGYWLAPQYWGRGLMTKIIKSFISFSFKEYKLKRIFAKVYIFNSASKVVLEKNGFKLEGILKKGAKKNGRYIDEYLLAKIK